MEVRHFVFLLKPATVTSRRLCVIVFASVLCLCATVSRAAEDQATDKPAAEDKTSSAPLADEQLLTPKVKRNKIKVGKIDTEDFELGVYGGLYTIEDFGTHAVTGARFAIHVSEGFFVEGNYGQTKGSRTSAEVLFERDFYTQAQRELTYYNVLLGYNLFPGEAFIGSNWAFVNALYFVAGAGNTKFAGEERFTIVGGFGYRFLVTDWLATHIDFKDHLFKTDFFGEEKHTNNMEVHAGFTLFF